MGKKKPEPWLAKFISAEMKQVIQWKRSLDGTIKPDPDSRFEDDGSNFRSEALAADLPANCLLQLIEVLLHQGKIKYGIFFKGCFHQCCLKKALVRHNEFPVKTQSQCNSMRIAHAHNLLD